MIVSLSLSRVALISLTDSLTWGYFYFSNHSHSSHPSALQSLLSQSTAHSLNHSPYPYPDVRVPCDFINSLAFNQWKKTFHLSRLIHLHCCCYFFSSRSIVSSSLDWCSCLCDASRFNRLASSSLSIARRKETAAINLSHCSLFTLALFTLLSSSLSFFLSFFPSLCWGEEKQEINFNINDTALFCSCTFAFVRNCFFSLLQLCVHVHTHSF